MEVAIELRDIKKMLDALFQLVPEYTLQSSVPMYPRPPVITIFLDIYIIVLY